MFNVTVVQQICYTSLLQNYCSQIVLTTVRFLHLIEATTPTVGLYTTSYPVYY